MLKLNALFGTALKLLMIDCTSIIGCNRYHLDRETETERSYLSMAGFSEHVPTHSHTIHISVTIQHTNQTCNHTLRINLCHC